MDRAQTEQRIDQFLTSRVTEALRAVDQAMPDFADAPVLPTVAEIARARIRVRHARGAPVAEYLIAALGDELLVHLQLNVARLVIVYRVPAVDGIDAGSLAPRLELWRRGAEHAGWAIGWREAQDPDARQQRYVEVYGYAHADRRLLADEVEELFWVNDIVQMTRAFMLEAHRCRIRLSPAAAGYVI